MKKYISLGLIIILITLSSVNAISNFNNKEIYDFKTNEQNSIINTNTVFIEQSTATWCPNCPYAAKALYNIYQSGNLSFYYVALVDDMNSIAKERNLDYCFGLYKIRAFPTIYLDGGYVNMVGRGKDVNETESEYRSIIQKADERESRKSMALESSVIWNDNAKLTVSITITNQGNSPYIGKIRSYVTEIESRWLDYSGDPYYFGFLDFALNNFIFLMPGGSKTLTGTFDGSSNHGGQTYSDITSNNIMVISTISNIIPHYNIGYQSDEYTQRYFAFYVDQTIAATPN